MSARWGLERLKLATKATARHIGIDVMRRWPNTYNEDGLRTFHGHDFVNDPKFISAYDYAFNATKEDPTHHGPWRVHVALWAAQTALRREGDFVECGTARAFVSTAILKYTDWNVTKGNRKFFLVDTFEGFVPDLLGSEEKRMIDHHGARYRDNYPDALRNVSPFQDVHLIKGAVPEVLPQIPAQKVAYLHLDMNSGQAEVAALEYLWPKIVLGGIVLLDDYSLAGYEPLRHAHDVLANKLGYAIASLPTGQGLIIK